MTKLMLMSALAGAILITTATTSCKKGDQGPAGVNGKDAKIDPTTIKLTTPVLAKAAVKTSLADYKKNKESPNLNGLDVTKLTEAKLVTQADKDALVAEKNALTTTAIKEKAIKDAQARKAALALIESVKGTLSSGLGAASATLEYYKSYKTESDKIVKGETYAFQKHIAQANHEAKNAQTTLLESLDCIKDEAGSLTQTAAKIDAELKAANDLKTATEQERTDAITAANLIRLTDAYGKEVADNAVSAAQKTAIENYLASKNTLVELINESKAAFSLSFKDLGITEELQKELGLVAAPVATGEKSKN